jgi:hypothetical protein
LWLVNQKLVADKKNAARKKYKYLIHGKKIEAKNRITHKFQDILISANKNKFWKVWKKAFINSNKVQNIKINDLSDKADIEILLAANFQKTCIPNNNTFETEFKCKYQHNENKYDNNLSNVIKIDVEDVDKAVYKLDLNKTCGFDNLSAEHIKFAHPSLISILSMLFKIWLHLGMVPDDFGLGVTKFIPKFKGVKKLCTSDDFRGITICPVISKIFELCIIRHFYELPVSDRQFGFKKGSSCHLAIHHVKKVIKYFNDKGSTMNIGVIDLKKAFDKVNHYGLLCSLQESHLNFKVINIIENWLCKSQSIVNWNGVAAHSVDCSAGVRQGGILSPSYFRFLLMWF